LSVVDHRQPLDDPRLSTLGQPDEARSEVPVGARDVPEPAVGRGLQVAVGRDDLVLPGHGTSLSASCPRPIADAAPNPRARIDAAEVESLPAACYTPPERSTMKRLQFRIDARAGGSRARAARFHTLHGEVLTPVFMPVGTRATVRGLSVEDLQAAGSTVLLANAYHLLLRPGLEVFARLGGIHRHMQWGGAVLTDSGGFQVFSLAADRAITEEGAVFRSYVDGTRILLSPERSIAVQEAIGGDIMMAMDQCIASTADHATAAAAMQLTRRWAVRSLAARGDSPRALFGIVQGACFADLRRESADALTRLPFDGFAIGGLAVGESKALRERFTELTTDLLPDDLPRYLMGVGTPADLLEAVHRGVDMFDCSIPSLLAKQGVAFTSR